LDWSKDGRYLIEEVQNTAKTGFDIWVLPLFGDKKPVPYLQTESNERMARLSPDGRWMVYTSDESKQDEVYIQTFPSAGGKLQISRNGGTNPVWSKDGRALFYLSGDRKLMAVDVKGSDGSLKSGVPMALFDIPQGTNNPTFDVSKDGRFLIPVGTGQSTANSLSMVINWQAGLTR